MKSYEKILFVAGAAVVGITMLYRYVLNDEQRSSLREAGEALSGAGRDVADSISPLMKDGPTYAEDEQRAAENRAQTAAEWEAIGY